MAKESAADRKAKWEEVARKKKMDADEKAAAKAKDDAQKKYEKRYMAFLDDVAKGDKRNFKQWKF